MSPFFFTMVLYSGKALRFNDGYEFKLRPSRWLASRMESQCSDPPVSLKDHTVVGHCVVETLQYWPHAPVNLIPQLFHYVKRQPRTERRRW